MAIGAFTVLTEFRFDVASAVIGTQTLTNKVEALSGAANNAVGQVKMLGASFVTHMGLGAGGIIGFFVNAVRSSEKFAQSQRNLANILLANRDHLKMGGLGYAKSLELSSGIMDQILKKAQKFGLDPGELLDQSKMISPMLINKGLDDQSMTRSIDIARGLLKSAPTLGLDPTNLQGQLIRLVEGNADMNNTLFLRLISEAGDEFKKFGIVDSKSYNAKGKKDPVTMIKALDAALFKFGNNTSILDANMRSVTGQLRMMNAMLSGQFSIFGNIGEALGAPIREILMDVNLWIASEGKKLSDQFASSLTLIMKQPQNAMARVMGMGKLDSQFSTIQSIVTMIGRVHAYSVGAKWAAGTELGKRVLGKNTSTVAAAAQAGENVADFFLGSLGPMKKKIAATNFWSGTLRGLPVLLAEVAGIVALLGFIFQSLSVGIAKAKIGNGIWLAQNLSRFTETLKVFGAAVLKVLYPLALAEKAFHAIGFFIGDLSMWGEVAIYLMNALAPAANALGNVVLGLMVVFGGATRVVAGLINTLWLTLNPANFLDEGSRKEMRRGLNFSQNFMDGMDFAGAQFRGIREGKLASEEEKEVSKANINIQHMEINNAFKEQMEPDRVAISVRDQFVKAALNPTSVKRGLTSGLVGA